ncbi:glycosyltransferase [Bacillus cereus]
MKSILIVTSDFPYPANHGGRKDVWEKIKVLKSMDFNINLIVTVKEEPSANDVEVVENYVESLKIIQRSISVSNLLSILPYQLESRKQLESIELTASDFMLIEGDYLFKILDNPNLKIKNKIIYRMHNNEEKYFSQLYKSEKNKFKKLFYLFESLKFKKVLSRYMDKCDEVWCISCDEQENLLSENESGRLTNEQILHIPPHVVMHEMRKRTKFNQKVLFIGSFFMINNREGIEWYLTKVHDNISRQVEGYELYLAGNSKGIGIEWLTKIIEDLNYSDNIKLFDTPDTLEDLYDSCSIFINPMLHGAGVKIKSVEAIKNGLAIVSTSTGIEGTGLVNGRHVLVANTTNDFSNSLIQLLEDEELTEKLICDSQKYVSENFNFEEKIVSSLGGDGK